MSARRWFPFRPKDWLAKPLDLGQFSRLVPYGRPERIIVDDPWAKGETSNLADSSGWYGDANFIPYDFGPPVDVREIVMVPRSGAMSSAGLNWPLWSKRKNSAHIMGDLTRSCVMCGFPMRLLAERPGPSYCSWRWTGREYDAPTPGEMLCSWAADMAWTIKDRWLRMRGQ